ncbi:ribonuclease H-like domain-containing protein [Tanacetum coccineum]|uniref:Ribonuclease H-like domain-containing protein n=1 Tax=Tanacetum coccineum TaxID=301880 RepID=A0ABQ4WL27_9ASTR
MSFIFSYACSDSLLLTPLCCDDIHEVTPRVSALAGCDNSVALTVVSVKLKRTENYQVWSCAMLLALEGKNKTGFIDGSCRRSNTDEFLGRQWNRVNVVVLGLHHKIHTLSQNGSSIADYYHKLNALWKQFDALIELPRCTCHAADDFKKHNQLMKLMQFLMGLDDTYMQIRSSILSRETLPNARSAYAIISSEESHRIATSSVSGTSQRSQTSAFNVNAPNRGNFQRSQTSTSFSKPSNNNRPNDNENRRTTGVLLCFSNGFSDEQLSTLISLIKENFVNGKGVHSNMAGLITDSGANQHITYTDKNLINVIDISYLKIKVTHPDRIEAFITRIENMPLTDYLTLYDVLVVPEYCDLRKGKILGTGKQIGGLYYYNGNQDVNHLNFFNFNTLDDLSKIPNDEERRNPNAIRDGNSPSHSGSTFAFSNENDAGHSHNVDASASENEIFAVDEDKISSSEGNDLHDQTQYNHKHWVDVMNAEMDALYRNNTWEIVDLPIGRKAIGSKWVWKIKYKSDGEIERYKARLVAKGFNQREGIDFDETFSLVVKIVIVRCLINLAVQSYFSDNETKVCKLNKSMYGLKQAPRQWNAKLTVALHENNFVQSKSDYSLFTKSFGEVFIALLVYVDDIIITENSLTKIEKVKQFLKTKFMIKDLGKLKYFLGIEPNISLTSEPSDTDPLLDNVTGYQKLIGKLIYLTTTRPDIAYTVSCLSQFMHNPLKSHLKTALKVIKYLKGSPGKGINVIKGSASIIDLKAYSDADRERCVDT